MTELKKYPPYEEQLKQLLEGQKLIPNANGKFALTHYLAQDFDDPSVDPTYPRWILDSGSRRFTFHDHALEPEVIDMLIELKDAANVLNILETRFAIFNQCEFYFRVDFKG